MTEVARDLGRLEGKLDLLLDRVSKFTDEHDKLAARVNELEKQHAQTKTTLGLAGGVLAFVAGVFGAMIDRLFK